MDPRTELSRLGEPDLAAVDRVWHRFERTRARAPRSRRRAVVAAVLLAATALLAVWATRPEVARRLDLDEPAPAEHAWSEQVTFVAQGEGHVAGTSQDVRIDWTSGRVRVEVAPHTGTRVAVVTAEARVEVVGTIFSVDRSALGSTVSVERGGVQVACEDGWRGTIAAGEAHTCLPATSAGLLGRAEALLDGAADPRTVLETLDRGLAMAGDGPIREELLARRMHQRAALGDVDGALADADAYLAHPSGRDLEVGRFAAWLLLSERGCDEAVPRLAALEAAGSGPDAVLLAECLAAAEPERARALVTGALPTLDASWRPRAERLLAALGEEAP